jgi:hypothetical protein
VCDYTTDAPYSHPECKKALTAPPTAGALLLKLAPLSALLIFFFFFFVVCLLTTSTLVFYSVFCLGFLTLFKNPKYLPYFASQQKRRKDRGESSKFLSLSLHLFKRTRIATWDRSIERTRETARELSSKFSPVILKKDLVLYASSLLLLLGLVSKRERRERAREERAREVIV